MSLILSIGKYGGFYIYTKQSFRVCIGWIAITILFEDIDLIITDYVDKRTNK